MNSNENYNSENDLNYRSSITDENESSETDNDKNDSISSAMQKTSRTINIIISQMIQINSAITQFLAEHNQN